MVSRCSGNTNGSYVVVQLEDIAIVLLILFGRGFFVSALQQGILAFFEHVQKNALGNL